MLPVLNMFIPREDILLNGKPCGVLAPLRRIWVRDAVCPSPFIIDPTEASDSVPRFPLVKRPRYPSPQAGHTPRSHPPMPVLTLACF